MTVGDHWWFIDLSWRVLFIKRDGRTSNWKYNNRICCALQHTEWYFWLRGAGAYHIYIYIHIRGGVTQTNSKGLTKIRPVVVCPEMSSPAQSLASVMNVPSNSCLPRWAFCSFCLGSLGAYSASLRQHKKAKARHIKTISNPARKVHMLERRKHQYLRSLRQSSGSMMLPASSVTTSGASVGGTQATAPSSVILCLLLPLRLPHTYLTYYWC